MKTLVIKPKKAFSLEDIKEVWRYKELLFFFVWRDIKVRYKQTTIGIFWAVIQPFVAMVIFSVLFGKLAGIPSDGIPYPIFVYTGLILWQFFSAALSDSANVLIANASIITKVYFPRLILPIADTATKLVDLFFSGIVLVFILFYYHYTPHLAGIILFPFLLFITFLLAVGGGLILSSINIKYRDVRYAVPYFMQMLMFVTPVIYPASLAGKYAWVIGLNPMAGIIKMARGSLLGTAPVDWGVLFISLLAGLVLFSIGVYFFKKTERYFADIV